MKITNATKVAIIGAVNAVISLLPTFGVAINPHTEVRILAITTVVLSGVAWLTRQLSPKWNNEITTIVNDVVSAAQEISSAAQVISQAATTITAAAAPKAATKTKATKE